MEPYFGYHGVFGTRFPGQAWSFLPISANTKNTNRSRAAIKQSDREADASSVRNQELVCYSQNIK